MMSEDQKPWPQPGECGPHCPLCNEDEPGHAEAVAELDKLLGVRPRDRLAKIEEGE